MGLHERRSGDVIILDPGGDITATASEHRLGERVRTLLDQGTKKILLDLEHVRRIDSSGLGELVFAKKAALVAGGDVKLLRPRTRVFGVLADTYLSRIFECFTEEEDAVASFRR